MLKEDASRCGVAGSNSCALNERMPPQPPSDPRLIPVLVAVGYLACIIALWGVTSLVTDTDPISERDAGPLLGPAMALSAAVVTALALWTLRRRRSLAVPAVAAAASAYVVMLIVGTVGYTFGRGRVAELALFPGRHALSPYLIGPGLLAGLAIVFLWLVTVRARRDAAAPDHLTGR